MGRKLYNNTANVSIWNGPNRVIYGGPKIIATLLFMKFGVSNPLIIKKVFDLPIIVLTSNEKITIDVIICTYLLYPVYEGVFTNFLET